MSVLCPERMMRNVAKERIYYKQKSENVRKDLPFARWLGSQHRRVTLTGHEQSDAVLLVTGLCIWFSL